MKNFTIVFIIMIFSTLIFGEGALEKNIAQFEKDGFIIDIKKLENKLYPNISPEKNAAFLYNRAFKLYDKKWDEHQALMKKVEQVVKKNQSLSSELKQEIEKFVDNNKRFIALIYQASAMHDCRFISDFGKTYAAKIPPLLPARQAAEILQMQVVYYANTNEPEKAIAAITTGMKLAQNFYKFPFLICCMIGVALESVTIKGCIYLINQQQLTKKQLQQLTSLINEERISTATEACELVELCVGIDAFRKLENGTFDGLNLHERSFKSRAQVFIYKASGLFAKDVVAYNRIMRHRIQNARKGTLKERLDGVKELENMIKKVDTKLMLTSNMDTGKILQVQCMAIVRLRVLKTVLVIENYRVANNKLPNNLSELAPQYLKSIPKDSAKNQALTYKKRQKGYIVYGWGTNEVDEGGKDLDVYDQGDIALAVIR